jgi:hypothetical protein
LHVQYVLSGNSIYIQIRYTILAHTTLKPFCPFIDLEKNLCFSRFIFVKPHFFSFFLVLFCEKSRFFLVFSRFFFGENLVFSRFYFSRKYPNTVSHLHSRLKILVQKTRAIFKYIYTYTYANL